MVNFVGEWRQERMVIESHKHQCISVPSLPVLGPRIHGLLPKNDRNSGQQMLWRLVPLYDISFTMPKIRLQTARPGLTGDMHTTTSPTVSFLNFLDRCSIATISPSMLNVGSMDGPMH